MRWGQHMAIVLAFVAPAVTGGSPSMASPRARHISAHHVEARSVVGGKYASHRMRGRLTTVRRHGHFAELVGDPGSGYGFYPLPWVYRAGAWRARQRRAMASAEAIGVAVASTAIYSYGFPYGDDYGFGHHHGVFNPIDGYGTPFFAGYYGPAGGAGRERGPFGTPYNN